MFDRIPRRRATQLACFVLLLGATALVAHARQVAAPQPVPPAPPPQSGAPRIEVAFVLDTTGSMSGLIEGAKAKIWSIASQLAQGQPAPEIRVGLLGYRDRGDDFVTRRFDLSDDLDTVYGHLAAFEAGGGGDTPESVNQALHEAVTGMGWSEGPGVYRVIFLVGDAPPHMDYPDDVPYPRSVRLAAGRGIVVNTVQCGGIGATAPIWKQIAQMGSGQYAAIAQDGAMVALETPLDDELAQLNRELASTVVAYGDADERAELAAKSARATALPKAAAAARLSYLGKTGGRVNAGRADLVDAVREGIVEAEALPEDALPAEMQAMTTEERGAYVREQGEKREALKERIDTLSRDRDAYVRTETARLAAEGKGDGFDQKVLETIRDQASDAGITYR